MRVADDSTFAHRKTRMRRWIKDSNPLVFAVVAGPMKPCDLAKNNSSLQVWLPVATKMSNET
jgi:hypothetical protein